MIEFLAVTILTVVCLLGLAQMAVWVWARDVAVSAAHEGARTAAEQRSTARRRRRTGRVRCCATAWARAAQDFVVDVAQDRATRSRCAPVASHRSIVPFLPRFAVDVRGHGVRRGRRAAMNDRERGSAIVEFAVLGDARVRGAGAGDRALRACCTARRSPRARRRVSTGARSVARRLRSTTRRARGALVVEQAARNHGLAGGSVARRPSTGGGPAASSSTVHVRTEVPVVPHPVRRRGLALGRGTGGGDARRADRPLPQPTVSARPRRQAGQASVVLIGALLIGLAFTGSGGRRGPPLHRAARSAERRRLRRARRRVGHRRGSTSARRDGREVRLDAAACPSPRPTACSPRRGSRRRPGSRSTCEPDRVVVRVAAPGRDDVPAHHRPREERIGASATAGPQTG